MDIAFILPTISTVPSGGHKIVYDYANALVRIGHKVTIYYITEKLLKRRIHIEIVRKVVCGLVSPVFPTWYKLDRKVKVRSLFERKIKRNHDIIIATAVRTAYFLAETASESCKGYFIQGFETWNAMNEEVYRSYNLIDNKISVSKWLYEIIKENSGGEVRLLSNPIDKSKFKCINKVAGRINHSIAFHYRTEECKGSVYAIETVKRLKEEYKDLMVFVVGIEERPEDLPVYCKYYCKAKPELISAINNKVQVFLCTSINEGFGLPGMEAMACGCALVSTDYAGVREYAVDGSNALLSPPKDVDSLVRNIKRLFEDGVLRESLVMNGLKATANCSIESRAEQLIDIIDEFTRGRA